MKRWMGLQKTIAIGLAGIAVLGMATAFSIPVVAQVAAWPESQATVGRVTVDEALPAPLTAAVQVTVAVTPSRLIIVDEDDKVIEIYSNARAVQEGAYTLQVRQGGQQGQKHLLTDGVQAQYTLLLAEVDWSRTGRVYP
ncbi:MAG: hypothetical protein Q7T04_02510 [Dehalococcoidia bacterium]|nr:hypothetical protein [Dehalococcoidia bacterium]